MVKKTPLANAKVVNVKATLKPANAMCVLFGHNFGPDGKCTRNVPNLVDKTKLGGKCDGKQ